YWVTRIGWTLRRSSSRNSGRRLINLADDSPESPALFFFFRARLFSGGQDHFLAGKIIFWRARLFPGGQDYFLAGKTISWRARLFSGGQDCFLAGESISWRARLFHGGQDHFLAGKIISWGSLLPSPLIANFE